MLDQFLPTGPRTALEIAALEGSYQQLRLVQPRGVGRREPRSPPIPALQPVRRRIPGGVARVSILDQKHALQSPMPAAKGPQLPDVMLGILGSLHGYLHPARMNDQEQQQVHRAVPGVLEFLLLDRPRNCPPPRLTFQDLEVRALIDAHRPAAV